MSARGAAGLLLALGAGLGLPAAAGCAREPVPTWPQGTVLALDSVPIRAEEVDLFANSFAMLEPRDSLEQLRRLSLTNVVLPRIAARAIDPAGRERALAEARALRQALVAGLPTEGPIRAPALVTRRGGMLDLGLELWTAAMVLEGGVWSEPLETAGCFHLFRLVERSPGPTAGLVVLTLESFDFAWLSPDHAREQIERQLDRSRLHYVDESWRLVVPTAWQYRLRGGTP